MNNSTSVSLSSTITKSDNFIESNVDDETIFMHLDEGEFLSTKSTGQRIWQLLDQPASVSEICVSLMKEFEVSEAECQEQTLAFVQSLAYANLVEVSS